MPQRLASGVELGINRDHSGIVEWPAALLEAARLRPDAIIDVDNKSLTHRPDLWGHYGMAREVAAITGSDLQDRVNPALIPALGGPVKIEIEDLKHLENIIQGVRKIPGVHDVQRLQRV